MAVNKDCQDDEVESVEEQREIFSWNNFTLSEGYPSGALSQEIPLLSDRGISQVLPDALQTDLHQHNIIIQPGTSSELGTEVPVEIELQTQDIDVETCVSESERDDNAKQRNIEGEVPDQEVVVGSVEVVVWSSVDESSMDEDPMSQESTKMINQSYTSNVDGREDKEEHAAALLGRESGHTPSQVGKVRKEELPVSSAESDVFYTPLLGGEFSGCDNKENSCSRDTNVPGECSGVESSEEPLVDYIPDSSGISGVGAGHDSIRVVATKKVFIIPKERDSHLIAFSKDELPRACQSSQGSIEEPDMMIKSCPDEHLSMENAEDIEPKKREVILFHTATEQRDESKRLASLISVTQKPAEHAKPLVKRLAIIISRELDTSLEAFSHDDVVLSKRPIPHVVRWPHQAVEEVCNVEVVSFPSTLSSILAPSTSTAIHSASYMYQHQISSSSSMTPASVPNTTDLLLQRTVLAPVATTSTSASRLFVPRLLTSSTYQPQVSASHASLSQSPACTLQASRSKSPPCTSQASTSKSPACTSQASTSKSPACTSQAVISQSPAYTSQDSTSQSPSCTTHAIISQSPAYTSQDSTSQSPSCTTQANITQSPAHTSHATMGLSPACTSQPTIHQSPGGKLGDDDGEVEEFQGRRITRGSARKQRENIKDNKRGRGKREVLKRRLLKRDQGKGLGGRRGVIDVDRGGKIAGKGEVERLGRKIEGEQPPERRRGDGDKKLLAPVFVHDLLDEVEEVAYERGREKDGDEFMYTTDSEIGSPQEVRLESPSQSRNHLSCIPEREDRDDRRDSGGGDGGRSTKEAVKNTIEDENGTKSGEIGTLESETSWQHVVKDITHHDNDRTPPLHCSSDPAPNDGSHTPKVGISSFLSVASLPPFLRNLNSLVSSAVWFKSPGRNSPNDINQEKRDNFHKKPHSKASENPADRTVPGPSAVTVSSASVLGNSIGGVAGQVQNIAGSASEGEQEVVGGGTCQLLNIAGSASEGEQEVVGGGASQVQNIARSTSESEQEIVGGEASQVQNIAGSASVDEQEIVGGGASQVQNNTESASENEQEIVGGGASQVQNITGSASEGEQEGGWSGQLQNIAESYSEEASDYEVNVRGSGRVLVITETSSEDDIQSDRVLASSQWKNKERVDWEDRNGGRLTSEIRRAESTEVEMLGGKEESDGGGGEEIQECDVDSQPGTLEVDVEGSWTPDLIMTGATSRGELLANSTGNVIASGTGYVVTSAVATNSRKRASSVSPSIEEKSLRTEKPLGQQVPTYEVSSSPPVSLSTKAKRARFELFSGTKTPSPLITKKWEKLEGVQAMGESIENPCPPPSPHSKDNPPTVGKNTDTVKRASTKRDMSPLFPSLVHVKWAHLENNSDTRESISSSPTVKSPTLPIGEARLSLKKKLRLDQCLPLKDSTGNITIGTPHYSQPTFQLGHAREEREPCRKLLCPDNGSVEARVQVGTSTAMELSRTSVSPGPVEPTTSVRTGTELSPPVISVSANSQPPQTSESAGPCSVSPRSDTCPTPNSPPSSPCHSPHSRTLCPSSPCRSPHSRTLCPSSSPYHNQHSSTLCPPSSTCHNLHSLPSPCNKAEQQETGPTRYKSNVPSNITDRIHSHYMSAALQNCRLRVGTLCDVWSGHSSVTPQSSYGNSPTTTSAS